MSDPKSARRAASRARSAAIPDVVVCALGKMMAMIESRERCPGQQAHQVIAARLSDGSCVLGMDGLWVNGTEVRPDLDYIADFSPDGLRDLGPITEVLRHWPKDVAFCVDCVDILSVTHH